MTRKRKHEKSGPAAKENSLAVEFGRLVKLIALHLLKDVKDEGAKVAKLNAVGFSTAEIASMLNKTELNVRVQISQTKSKKAKGK